MSDYQSALTYSKYLAMQIKAIETGLSVAHDRDQS